MTILLAWLNESWATGILHSNLKSMMRLNYLYKMYDLANTRCSPVVRSFDYLVDPALCIVKCLDKYLIRAKNWPD